MLNFWLIFGIILIVSEIIIPGMVVSFVGLGALTVALLLHFEFAQSLLSQLLFFFSISLIYCFTLRLLVIRFYPSDTEKKDLDSELSNIGKKATVLEHITPNSGRISLEESSWNARTVKDEKIEVGETVVTVKQENITFIVEKIN